MTVRPFLMSLLCSLLCCTLSARLALAEGSSKETQAATATYAATLFDEGREAFEAGDLETALDRLKRAHDIKPDHRTAAVLGQIQLELGHHAAAAAYLDESVRRFPQGTDPDGLARVMDGLSQAKSHVATLRVASSTPGAELWLDGEAVGALPIAHDLYVDAGRHELELRAPGYRAARRAEHLPIGGSRDVTFTLEPLPGEQDALPPTDSQRTARVALVTGSAAALLGLGAGVGFELWARSAENRAQGLRASGQCGAGEVRTCAELREQSDRAATRHDLATSAFVASGAIGLVTATVFAVLRSGSSGATEPVADGARVELEFAPWVAPAGAGLGVVGGFR